MVDRYNARGYDPSMTAEHGGAWVRHSDYAALQAELETVKGDNVRLECQVDELSEQLRNYERDPVGLQWKRRAEAAEAKLAGGEVVGWIVGNGTGLRWRCWKDGLPDWTADKEKATHYSRRVDAEEACREDEDAWIVVPHALAHPAPTHNDGSGEAVAAFGHGNLIVDTGTAHGQPAVFIRPSPEPGPVGEKTRDEHKGPLDRLVPGEIFMTFPTDEQAQRVADALCNASHTSGEVTEAALHWRAHEKDECEVAEPDYRIDLFDCELFCGDKSLGTHRGLEHAKAAAERHFALRGDAS